MPTPTPDKVATDKSPYNQELNSILADYNSTNQTAPPIEYQLFKAIALAFLKENNEELKTVLDNKEARDELFDFCNYVTKSKNPNIQQIVNHLE
jgi:hypothetical protein